MHRRSFLAGATATALLYPQMALAQPAGLGRYYGTLTLKPLSGGRLMSVVSPFGYIDAKGLDWRVRAGAVTDGASIPSIFWPIIGTPFVGTYREAAVVHDWYCAVRTRKWDATHRMFYEAMQTSGVSPTLARAMFLAVFYAGPSWDALTTTNSILASGNGNNFPAFISRMTSDGRQSYYALKPNNVVAGLPSLGQQFSASEFDKLVATNGVRLAPSIEAYAGTIVESPAPTSVPTPPPPAPTMTESELQERFKELAAKVEQDGLDGAGIEALVERTGRVETQVRALASVAPAVSQ